MFYRTNDFNYIHASFSPPYNLLYKNAKLPGLKLRHSTMIHGLKHTLNSGSAARIVPGMRESASKSGDTCLRLGRQISRQSLLRCNQAEIAPGLFLLSQRTCINNVSWDEGTVTPPQLLNSQEILNYVRSMLLQVLGETEKTHCSTVRLNERKVLIWRDNKTYNWFGRRSRP